MSRHYDPYRSNDASQHPFNRSWRRVVEQGRSTLSWLSLSMKAGFAWCLQTGVRPGTAGVLGSQDAQPVTPNVEEIKRELRSVRPRTLDADLFPMTLDRRPAHLENRLSTAPRPPAS